MYASVMVIIVAAILSFTSEALKPIQQENVKIEKIQNILSSVSIESTKENAEELFNKYIPHPYNDNMVDDIPQINQLWDWSNNHKTMICLNGGMNSDLITTKKFFEDEDIQYPWATFYESKFDEIDYSALF